MGPASAIIEICGGHKNVADWLGVDLTRVFRWTYPKSKDGSDGYIPSQYHQTLLLRARAEGKDLKPQHFFPKYEESATSGQRDSSRRNHQRAEAR
jgi:hypothetical protein